MLSIQIGLTWALVMAFAISFGLPFAALIRTRGPEAIRVALWTGLTILTIFAMTLVWIGPLVSFGVRLTLLGLGIASVLATAFFVGTTWLRQGWHRVPLLLAILLGAGLLALAIGSSLYPTHYDFALYHYSGLQWAANYGTVPGLANLIDYLGYSNSATPWSALLMNGPAGANGFSAFVGVWVVALIVDALLRLGSKRMQRCAGTYVALANVLVVMLPVLTFADLWAASPTSDTAVFVLVLAASSALSDLVTCKKQLGAHLLLSLSPLLIASSMRPQILLILAVTSLIALAAAFRRRHELRGTVLAISVGITSLFGLALGALSLARDYRLSGWAVYPLSLFPFDVPWRAEEPTGLRTITIGIARDPGPAYQEAATGYSWLVPWALRQTQSWELWLTLLLTLLGVGLLVLARHRGHQLRIRALVATLAPVLTFSIAWIVVLPPTWRHAWGPIFAAGALLIGWGLWRMQISPRVCGNTIGLGILGISVVALVVRFPSKPIERSDSVTGTFSTDSGLELSTPTSGDRCGIAPLLCTPMPRGDLRLRGEDLGDGFVRNGAL